VVALFKETCLATGDFRRGQAMQGKWILIAARPSPGFRDADVEGIFSKAVRSITGHGQSPRVSHS
jgi:hypothetical protein